ncbi:MAG: hypothetical protein PWP04_356 [Candidatus Atribacteria bacterium]|nr:hypothetical protein [Candidatus Atribacteria bacterium]
MTKLLWLVDNPLLLPDFWLEKMEKEKGWKIEIRDRESKVLNFIDYDRIFILGDSLSFTRERLSLLAYEWKVNPSKIQVFPWEEVKIVFPQSFFSILEQFIAQSLAKPLAPLVAERVVPENKVLVLPQASQTLDQALKEKGIETVVAPSSTLRREGINFHLFPSGDTVGAVVVSPPEEITPPVSFSSEVEDTRKLVDLKFMEKEIEKKDFRGETIIFLLPKRGVTEKEWLQTFYLSRLLAKRDRAEIFVLVEEVLVAGENLEKEYRQARSCGVIFEKVTFSSLFAQPTLDMRGIEVEFTTERDRLKRKIKADWLVSLPERNVLPFDLAPFFDSDRIEEAILPLANPNLSSFSPGIEGIFVSLPGEEKNLVQVIEKYLTQGIVRERGRVEVNEEKCILCLTCLRTCPWRAVAIEKERKKTRVNWELCHLCGLCASFCPAHAIEIKGLSFEDWLSPVSLGGEK